MSNKLVHDYLPDQKAWVVFSGQTDLRWLKFLKPGFKHCYVLLHDGQSWTSVDPLSHLTEVAVHHHVPADFDLPDWLSKRGLTVIPAKINRESKQVAPLMLFTCVEAVKRLIGLRKRFVFTPWQLYRHLTQSSYSYSKNYKGETPWVAEV